MTAAGAAATDLGGAFGFLEREPQVLGTGWSTEFRRPGTTASDDVLVAQRVHDGLEIGDPLFIPPFGFSAERPQAEGSADAAAPPATRRILVAR